MRGKIFGMKIMELPVLEFQTPELLERWLDAPHDNSKGIWLKMYKQNTETLSINYTEALDV
ncbi:MAG TPA: hypothetical protein VKZ42_03955 [Flavobacteriaceae bacterium]|nr:hypothetical protein [Flavobacteriaceae bacterium]